MDLLLAALPLLSECLRGTFSLSSVTSGRGILIRILGLECERATTGIKSKCERATTGINNRNQIETHILLSLNGNMIMKKKNAMCEKDSPPLIFNASNFCSEIER
jgi:hypothetical protein